MDSSLLVSPRGYFNLLTEEAFKARKLEPPLKVRSYIVDLLEYFLDSKNFHFKYESSESIPQQVTLAELYLTAQQKDNNEKFKLLKFTGDKALYVGGYFGDSLNRKIVDVEYYAQIGCSAYANLSSIVHDADMREVYTQLARDFTSYIDVLTVISHKTLVKSDLGIIQIYDKYLKTGSPLAKEALIEQGLFHLVKDSLKKQGA